MEITKNELLKLELSLLDDLLFVDKVLDDMIDNLKEKEQELDRWIKK